MPAFGILPEKVTYLDTHTNIFYKVEDTSGNRYAVKVNQDQDILEMDNQIEAQLLMQLSKNGLFQFLDSFLPCKVTPTLLATPTPWTNPSG